jgi:endonuclease III-like uncharacterized protein
VYQKLLEILKCNIKRLCSFADEYPNYDMDAKSLEVEDAEITYITSLLMLHSVLKSENKRIMDHMYNLDHDTQIHIKNFFEINLQYGANITRSDLKHAIDEYGKSFCSE